MTPRSPLRFGLLSLTASNAVCLLLAAMPAAAQHAGERGGLELWTAKTRIEGARDAHFASARATGNSDRSTQQDIALRDGEVADAVGKHAVPDGIIDEQEPEPVADGTDPNIIDTRPQDDREVFALPQDDRDPLLFTIEDLAPRDDRRPERLFLLEPYDPKGIAIGSFLLFPETEVAGLWNSNVVGSPEASSDATLEVRPAVRLVSNWNAHALELRASGIFSRFDEAAAANENGYDLEVRGRIDVQRRTNVQALVNRSVGKGNLSGIGAGMAGERLDVTADRATVAFNHRFNRLLLQLRGTVAESEYSQAQDPNAPSDRDVSSREAAVRAGWEFKPSFTLFAEAAIGRQEYRAVAQSDGISRDADTESIRIGVDFGGSGPFIRGEVSAGYGRLVADDTRLDAVEGMIAEANLAWRPTGLTSVLFTAGSAIAEGTAGGSGGVFVRRAGLGLRHSFLRHLVANAGVSAEWRDFDGVAIEEHEWRATIGLEYFLSREAAVSGGYEHVVFSGSGPVAGYGSDIIRVGLRMRQ